MFIKIFSHHQDSSVSPHQMLLVVFVVHLLGKPQYRAVTLIDEKYNPLYIHLDLSPHMA
jgi:hypothetical protein